MGEANENLPSDEGEKEVVVEECLVVKVGEIVWE